MQSFSLKRLMGSATIFSMGLAAIVFVVRQAAAYDSNIDIFAFLAGWVAGGTAIGAGVFLPFRFTMLGALLGFVVQIILFFVVVIAKS